MQEQESTPLKPTRASFIRSLPESMPIAEVIERGREAGLEIKPSDIHAARYYMRQANGGQAPSRPVTHISVASAIQTAAAANQPVEAKRPRTKSALPPRDPEELEEEMRQLVMRLGTERARAIIKAVERELLGA
jgi:hypothetical protein